MKATPNDFWALGPNVTGYMGGFPNGFMQRLKRERIWGHNRLHLCSGTVQDGTTIDINPELRPTIVADLNNGIPFKDNSFDFILIDPPYSKERAEELYACSLLSVPHLLKESARVVQHDGLVALLDLRVWPPKTPLLRWKKLIAVYTANPGPKHLRALSVFQKVPKPLSEWI